MSLSAPAWAGDFVDTRLSFVFADDNVLADAGETTPNSPIGPLRRAVNQNTQFYDNFNTRFSGFETLSNVVLYKRMPAFFEGLTTEAALTVLVLERPSGGIDLRDNSSYIRLHYRPPGWGENEGLSLTGFPVSADRFRLGYAYRISWGGSGIFTTRAAGRRACRAPSCSSRATSWYAYVGRQDGAACSTISSTSRRRSTASWRAPAGTSLETLRLEAGGGYFQKGIVPGLADAGRRGAGELGGRVRAGRLPRGRAGGHERRLPAVPERPRGLPALLPPGAVPGRPVLLGVARGQLPGADAGGSGRVRRARCRRRPRRWRCRRASSGTTGASTCWACTATCPSSSSTCPASRPSTTSRRARS